MKTRRIKGEVRAFRRDFSMRRVSLEELIGALEKQGFTLVEFNPVVNDPDVETIVHTLGLTEQIQHSQGFLFVNEFYRLAFLNEKLSEEEKLLVLSHEEGHYYLGHMSGGVCVGASVYEEFEAHEFARLLLKPSFPEKVKGLLARHKRFLLILLLLLLMGLFGGYGVKERHDRSLYEGEYYVTPKGTRYHLKNCMTIQGHEVKRLTKEDVRCGDYKPCSVCQP